MKSVIPQRLLTENKNRLQYIKDNLSLMFDDIGNYIIYTINEITSFKGKMKPYVNYFYPTETDSNGKSFLDEVVLPCRKEMEWVITNILGMLENNKQTREGLDVNIDQFNTLQGTVKELLTVLGEIRQGIHGPGVSMAEPVEHDPYGDIIISVQNVLPVIDELSVDFNSMIDEFNSIYQSFVDIKDWIIREHEGYLSNIRKKTKSTFEGLVAHIHNSSAQVNELLKHLDTVVGIIKEIINRLQMEDVERQNLEKIIYFMNEFASDFSAIYEHCGKQLGDAQVDEVVLSVLQKKLHSVKGSFTDLISGLDDCFNMLTDSLQDGVKDSTLSNDYGKGVIGEMYHDIEKLENEFLDHVAQVKQMIKELNMLFHRIFNLKRKFGTFFLKVKSTSTVLGELDISGEAEGADGPGKDILRENLKKLKELIGKTAAMYNEINYSVGVSVLKHHENLIKQEDILQEAIFSIKKVSSKLFESKNYYFDLSEEIRKNSRDILEFISREDKKMSNLRDADKTIGKINAGFEDYHKLINKEYPDTGVSHFSEITTLRAYFEETGEKGDYKNMMLVSLLSEFCDEQSEEEVEFF